jgi:predicted O-methyltransferase YrrM
MTDDRTWSTVDDWITRLIVRPDAALEQALRDNAAAKLPAMDVTPAQGKLLYLLARACQARRVLEIGTLGGYSTIWLARALPADGELVTLEISAEHAAVARTNLDRAGVGDRVRIVVGPALETLPTLAGPFDLTFIDADKPANADYLEWALRLARPGGLVVVDNVVRGGRIADPDDPDPNVVGTRRLADVLAAEPRIAATMIQTVSAKGHDGFLLGVVAG